MQNGSQTTQTVQQQAPSWQSPYQQYGLQQATANYQNVNSPQQLVAGFSPQQNQAIQGITNLAGGTPQTTSAQNYVTSVLNGNPAQNPYLSQQFNLAANDVQNRLSSEFAGSGRNVIGSLPVQSDQLNNLATQLYGGAYNTGVQQQENALAQAVPLEQQQFNAQNNLFNAGGAIQGLAQQYITAPQTFLNQYLSQVNGNLGATQSIQQPVTPYQQLAMSATGAGLGSQLGTQIGNAFGGQGGTIGGLIGGLGGAFL